MVIDASGYGKDQRRLEMATEAAQPGSLEYHDSRYTGVCANGRRFQGEDHSLVLTGLVHWIQAAGVRATVQNLVSGSKFGLHRRPS